MILAKSSNIHKKNISKIFSDVFKYLKFHGLVMVEVKFFNNKFYVIEANPRFWGPSQLILDSGMDLFYCFAKENNLINNIPKIKYEENVWYFWQGGLISELNKGNIVKKYFYEKFNFLDNYDRIIKNEVYFEKDSINIFLHENK